MVSKPIHLTQQVEFGQATSGSVPKLKSGAAPSPVKLQYRYSTAQYITVISRSLSDNCHVFSLIKISPLLQSSQNLNDQQHSVTRLLVNDYSNSCPFSFSTSPEIHSPSYHSNCYRGHYRIVLGRFLLIAPRIYLQEVFNRLRLGLFFTQNLFAPRSIS